LHKKHENQPPNQKVVLPVAPFFVIGSKLQLFSSMGLNDQIVAQKNFKINPQIKSGATGSTIFCNRVKITTFFKHGLKGSNGCSKKL
jgi:hypothetical protein